MVQESIYAVDGEEINAIRDAASRSNIIVSLGFTEKVKYSSGTLFNSNIIIGNKKGGSGSGRGGDGGGEVLVHHRKLVPTWVEKLTWAAGDGHGLHVADTEYGKIGTLICGENTNPLARFAMMAQGEQVHISTWPPIWASRLEAFETSKNAQNARDARNAATKQSANVPVSKKKNYDNVAANRTRAAAHCFEGKCFGIMCAPFMSQENIDDVCALTEDPAQTRQILEGTPKAASMFLDPTGASLPGFVISMDEGGGGYQQQPREYLQHEEGILYADMDLDQCVEGKQYHDVVGGYQRFDVFELKVNRRRQVPVVFDDDGRKL